MRCASRCARGHRCRGYDGSGATTISASVDSPTSKRRAVSCRLVGPAQQRFDGLHCHCQAEHRLGRVSQAFFAGSGSPSQRGHTTRERPRTRRGRRRGLSRGVLPFAGCVASRGLCCISREPWPLLPVAATWPIAFRHHPMGPPRRTRITQHGPRAVRWWLRPCKRFQVLSARCGPMPTTAGRGGWPHPWFVRAGAAYPAAPR